MRRNYYRVFMLLLVFLYNIPVAFSQDEDAVPGYILSGKVVDTANKAIPFATIVYGEGMNETTANARGEFRMKVKGNDELTIKAYGYETLIVDKYELNGGVFTLKQPPLYMSADDLIKIPFGALYKRQLVGAVFVIKGSSLESIPDPSLTNSLAGQAAGLTVLQTAGTPGWNSANLYVRGLNGSSDNAPLIIVDGIERPMNDLNAEEIESVQVLKDITSKTLYGARGANGVIMVTTKRGKVNTRERNVSVEYGLKMPERMPKFLDAGDYTLLFNEARRNDGLPEYYYNSEIEGYKKGNANSLMYTNVDFYEELLKKSMPYKKAVLQFRGGNNRAQYYMNLGYLGEGGLEKVGPATTFNRLNLRANLDYAISRMVKMYVDVVGRMEFRNANNLSSQDFFGRMSGHRPNEYPFIIRSNRDTVIYGGSFYSSGNVYAQMSEGGYSKRVDRTGQTNVGVDINLGDITPGLSAKAYVTFDIYNYVTYGKSQNFYSYVPVWAASSTGRDSMYLVQLSTGTKVSGQSRWGDDGYRNIGYYYQLNYNRTFGNVHTFNSDLLYFRNKRELRGSSQDIKNETMALRANYMFKNKLIAEIDITGLGSSKFAASKRYGVFPSAGMGWVISEESFAKDLIRNNYLKLRASYGIIGTDRNIDFYQFENRWGYWGNANFGTNNENRPGVTNVVTIANPGVTWEKAKELNIGLEGSFIKRKLGVEVNYFINDRYDILSNRSNSYPQILGGLLPVENFGRILNKGIEAGVDYKGTVGDLSYFVAANIIYSKAVNKVYDDLPGYPGNRRRTNEAVDAVFGYVSNGLFQSLEEINGAPVQRLGPVSPGDIRYQDLDNNGYIDQNDVRIIGNTFPRVTYGFNIGLQYKKWGMQVNGAGIGDVQRFNNNSYYWINDVNRKYSDIVWNRWTPQTASTATYPRLTTLRGTNNYQNSTFWLTDASFFRIKAAELSYTLDQEQISFLKAMKIFLRGNNLLIFSKLKDLDPEDAGAGLTNFPIFRTFTGGISVSF